MEEKVAVFTGQKWRKELIRCLILRLSLGQDLINRGKKKAARRQLSFNEHKKLTG
jgi:hypothetical protein